MVESSTRVVISNSIGVRIRRRLCKVRLSISSMVSNNRSMMNYRRVGYSNWMSNSYWMGNGNWVGNCVTKAMTNETWSS